MTITTVAKLLSGIVVFVLMANVLGPKQFGLIAYSFTVASLLCLIIDYGFSQQLLKNIGADNTKTQLIMGNVLSAKVFLTFVLLVVSILYIMFSDFLTEEIIVFSLLLLSSIIFSFCEFCNVGLRGNGLFKNETKIATVGALAHFFIVIVLLYKFKTVTAVAIGFLISRIINFIISFNAYRKFLGLLKFGPIGKIKNTLTAGFPYAVDVSFNSFSQQVDTLIVNHYLGLSGVGLYQAATKWLQGALQFAPILSNVFLPSLSATKNNQKYLIESKLFKYMFIIGLLWLIFFTFFADSISNYIYGEKFFLLNELWVLIGILVFFRYIAASQGVKLTAYGFQKIRVYVQILALIVLIISSILLVPVDGLKGMVKSLIYSAIVVNGLYYIYIKFKVNL